MSLTLKELRAPTTWPNRWLRNLAAGAETMIRDAMVNVMRRKLMVGALFGTGSVPNDGSSTGAEPLGVRYTPGVTVTALSPAAVLEIGDLRTAIAALEDANVDETDTWGWVSHSRTFRTFEFMVDNNGQPILRNSWTDGVRVRSLVDYPYFKTNAVPKNLGSGANESVLFFGSWQELIIGMGSDVELLVSEHLKMNFNSTYVMAVAYVDTAVAYPEAFHVTTGVL
jgi:HK97 family phage major capsid protein